MTDESSNDSVTVVRDRRRDFGDHIVRIRVLSVPTSEQFPDGIKYAFHYGRKGAAEPILRYDNYHGLHERHEGTEVAVIEFPGYEQLLDRFIDELPADHAP
jgi:hypothetical protein